jgi:ATP/maltotriose-dependent transcriptional regulator MalT
MVAGTAGEVSPLLAGGIYCSVIEACGEIFDLRRAQEWTSALDRWCAAHPEVVPFRGHCMVRRSEILQLHGDWSAALDQAQRACEELSHPTPKLAAGAAYDRLGELHRLRGEFAEAEQAYRHAKQSERSPQPGFALLRFAQGQVEAARVAIQHVVDEAREPGSRARALEAYVEIALAADDIARARAAAEELAQIACRFGSPVTDAVSARAIGAVLLAEDDCSGALSALRQALWIWRDLEAPYETARVRVLIALAHWQQGDDDSANLELDAARAIFEHLGAKPDLERLESLLKKPRPKSAGPLTTRELEVLLLVASGKSNRAIADRLYISEKTVARHLNNIFTKLDLPSRSAATAYAYQHDLVVYRSFPA